MKKNPSAHLPRFRALRAACWLGCGLVLAGCAPRPRVFSGERALQSAGEFLAFGPRVTGSEAGRKAGEWIAAELGGAGWAVDFDRGTYKDTPVVNIVGGKGEGEVILLGAHYDSRRCADRPSGGCAQPVPGADDGASGVAVLLELARTLDVERSGCQIWLVFFDAEDNGELDGWDWIVGARQFARAVEQYRAGGQTFRAMILLDMVGDADQRFYFEGNSDPALRGRIWSTAAALGYADHFLPQKKYSMIDDHIPFRDLGIPSVDIIDFDYPYWHTPEDTFDKLSAASLERVGRTLQVFLESGPDPSGGKP
jgi:glutaminyl-peptide cyclotransferase